MIEEVADRLRRREQAFSEQVERGEVEAAGRIEASFADVERRQVEKLKRVVEREGERYAEAAGQQFDVVVKAAREEAATRLSRELDRAVETFVRQSDSVFAERLAQTADAGQQRLEARLRQAQSAFERQRDELQETFAERVSEAEADLRRMLGAFAAEAEAERASLEARLAELAPRGLGGRPARVLTNTGLTTRGRDRPLQNEHAPHCGRHDGAPRPRRRTRQGEVLAPSRADGGRLPPAARREARRGARCRPARGGRAVGRPHLAAAARSCSSLAPQPLR